MTAVERPAGDHPAVEHERDARPTRRDATRIRIPLWRRITALFGLAFMSVLGGVALAGLLGMTALLLLFLLERAIAT